MRRNLRVLIALVKDFCVSRGFAASKVNRSGNCRRIKHCITECNTNPGKVIEVALTNTYEATSSRLHMASLNTNSRPPGRAK